MPDERPLYRMILGLPVDLASWNAEAFGQQVRTTVTESICDGVIAVRAEVFELRHGSVEESHIEKLSQPAEHVLRAAAVEQNNLGRVQEAVLVHRPNDLNIPRSRLERSHMRGTGETRFAFS